MRFASLGSGSKGNALVVESGGTKRVLFDCGFGIRETVRHLQRLDVEPESLSAILVTHEHSDHIGGVFKFATKSIPVWLTHGTLAAAPQSAAPLKDVVVIDGHSRYAIGDFELLPFPVPHDAREPVQYVFSDGLNRLGVLSDTGSLTAHIISMLDRCDAMVLECNHDAELLAASSYPLSLKRRISGRLGHLSNEAAASLLAQIDVSRLQHLVAAHLSEQEQSTRTRSRDADGCSGLCGKMDRGGNTGVPVDWRQIS